MNLDCKFQIGLLVLLLSVLPAVSAQETTQPAATGATEEVVVKGVKPDSVKRAERLRIERLRAQLLKDFRENEILAAKFGWRKEDVIKRRESRFKWGYDPQTDRTTHRSEQADGQWLETQPVSVFKTKF